MTTTPVHASSASAATPSVTTNATTTAADGGSSSFFASSSPSSSSLTSHSHSSSFAAHLLRVSLTCLIGGLSSGIGFFAGRGLLLLLTQQKWPSSRKRSPEGDAIDREGSGDEGGSTTVIRRRPRSGVDVDLTGNRKSLVARRDSGGGSSLGGGGRDIVRPQQHGTPSSGAATASAADKSTQCSGGENNGTPAAARRRCVEILVHNVSHTDMVLSLGRRSIVGRNRRRHHGRGRGGGKVDDDPSSSSGRDGAEDHRDVEDDDDDDDGSSEVVDPDDEDFVMCRPRFSAFDLYSRRVLRAIRSSDAAHIPVVSFPRYERNESSPRYSLITPRCPSKRRMPVGFAIDPPDMGAATGVGDDDDDGGEKEEGDNSHSPSSARGGGGIAPFRLSVAQSLGRKSLAAKFAAAVGGGGGDDGGEGGKGDGNGDNANKEFCGGEEEGLLRIRAADVHGVHLRIRGRDVPKVERFLAASSPSPSGEKGKKVGGKRLRDMQAGDVATMLGRKSLWTPSSSLARSPVKEEGGGGDDNDEGRGSGDDDDSRVPASKGIDSEEGDAGKAEDEHEHEYQDDDSLYINGVFFPLLSPLLPRWEAGIADKYGNSSSSSSSANDDRDKNSSTTKNQRGEQRGGARSSNTRVAVKKVIILVSGVGTPRNWTHSIRGNSTEACAELMEVFLNRLYPDVAVVRIHSETNIFRYDDNISFTKRELMPCIEAYRDAHARGEMYPDEIVEVGEEAGGDITGDDGVRPIHRGRTEHDPDWRETFHVALSFADGSPARTIAIQASLRPYRPKYYHFWQLKTLWHDSKVSDEDIEVLSFEDVETVPAMEASKASEKVQLVVEEIKRFKEYFLERNSGADCRSDLRKFWLRKTKKPVLAVLLVETPDGRLLLYRGTNMEVSMPTGSLCAERNVIGSALADNPGIKREDLRMVAVLAVPLPEVSKTGGKDGSSWRPPPTDPNVCGVVPSVEGARNGTFVDAEQEKLGYMKRSTSVTSFSSIVESAVEDDDESFSASWVKNVEKAENDDGPERKDKDGAPKTGSSSLSRSPRFSPAIRSMDGTSEPLIPPLNIGATTQSKEDAVDSETQIRRINLYTNSDADSDAGSDYGRGYAKKPVMGGARMQKKTVVVQSPKDLNPLRPCGACNEWLKKIAEPNPNFKVLTFTDAECNGVYVTPCQE